MNKINKISVLLLLVIYSSDATFASINEIDMCKKLDVDGEYYLLSKSVESAGTCFIIDANNITLDGNEYTVNLSQITDVTYGVYNYGHYNVTVKNLAIIEGNSTVPAYGIYFSGAGAAFGNISNNMIYSDNTNGRGFYLASSSNNNTLSNNIGITTTGYAFSLSNSFNNRLLNNNGTTLNVNVFFIASSDNNILSNNIGVATSGSGNAFYLSGSYNNTLTNNIGKGIGGKPFDLISSNNNILTDNNGSVIYGEVFRLSDSSNNILTNNNGIAGSGFIFMMESSSDNNTLSNNTGITTKDIGMPTITGYVIHINNSSFNNIINGSYYSKDGTDYYINSGTYNTVTNTNFTTRKIEFVTTDSYFNYSNNYGVTYISANVSVSKIVSRAIINWTQTNLTWTDNVTQGTATIYYNVLGLLANTTYYLYNGSVLKITSSTDAKGQLPLFSILQGTNPMTMTLTTTAMTTSTVSARNTEITVLLVIFILLLVVRNRHKK